MFAYVGLILFARYALSNEAQMQFGRCVTYILAAAFLLATLWAFVAARRRSLIGWPTVYVGASVWAALTAVVMMVWAVGFPGTLAAVSFLIGAAALSVAPLATAPLALAWNRHR
jgi:hypothetical protein